jgi:hypothetical protein
MTTRDELIFLLTEAAELEHSLMSLYLYAAFSLKRETKEGLTDDQLIKVADWGQTIYLVSRQEMEHLSLVSNILTAIGGAPHFYKPNMPQPAKYYPFPMTMERFTEDTIKRFVCFERPEHITEEDAFCLEQTALLNKTYPQLNNASNSAAPYPIPYRTLGELYAAIRQAISEADERDLFIGPPDAQIGTMALQYLYPKSIAFGPGVFDVYMFPVTDKASALKAVDLITEQGEGTPVDNPNSHYHRFLTILHEYQALKKQDPKFDPARNVIANPYLYAQFAPVGGNLVTQPQARALLDLFNGCYETLLLLMIRLFAHTDETTEEIDALLYTMYPLMTMAIRPLGEMLTLMPALEGNNTRMAGPTFEYYRSIQLLPHKTAAWIYLSERLAQLAGDAQTLVQSGKYPQRLGFIQENLAYTATRFAQLVK